MSDDRLDYIPRTPPVQPPPPQPRATVAARQALVERIQTLSLGEQMVLPFKLLGEHHIFLLFYAISLATFGLYLSYEFEALLLDSAGVVITQLKLKPGFAYFLKSTLSVFAWSLSLPVLLVAITLPIEIIWVYGHLRLPSLIARTPRSIFQAFQSIVLGIYRPSISSYHLSR